MDSKVVVALVLLVIVLVGIPLAGQVAKSMRSSEQPTAVAGGAAPSSAGAGSGMAPAAVANPGSRAGVQPPARPGHGQGQGRQNAAAPRRNNAPQAGQAPPYWNNQNLGNTAWAVDVPSYGTVTVQLFPGGQLVAQPSKLPIQVQGSWNVSGSNLGIKASAFGKNVNFNVKIVGDQLQGPNGEQARRVK